MGEMHSRIKRAELLSTVGAGVLGAGLALLMQRWLEGFAAALLVAGLFAHAWGMYAKRRLENESEVRRAPWEDAVYWLCWAALGGLAAYIVLRSL
jgi:hypothetical protein